MSAVDDFAAFLDSLGIRPKGPVTADGRWRRCPTDDHPKSDNGAWKLSPDGRIGWAQNWATMAEPITWRADSSAPAVITPVDLAALRKGQEKAREDQAKAILRARAYYEACTPLVGGHDYLRSKMLDMTGCSGLRRDRDGWLVVPMMQGGKVISLQRISDEGEKRFAKGAPTSGTSYDIDRIGATLTVLCEGLATGLALFAAVRTARVVVCFTASNLPKVAAQIPRRGMAVIAADNDHATAERIGRNPGVDAAEEAARVLGCGVAAPAGIRGSDWADYRYERVLALLEEGKKYGARARVTEASARRQVDGEIARRVVASACFLPVAG